jgi:micrococcal nuclease
MATWNFPDIQIDDDSLWWYRAQWISNYDGDTIDLLVDFGAGTFRKWRVRLYGVDTPERRKPTYDEGVEAENIARRFLTDNRENEEKTLTDWLKHWPLRVKTIKDRTGKYGRYLAIIYFEDGASLNGMLIEDYGWAAPESWQ